MPARTATDKLVRVKSVLKVDEPTYFVKLDDARYLDAEESGNTARFINHRCVGFNAVLRKVKAQGDIHVLVEAVKDIAEGEEITRCYEEVQAHAMAEDKYCQCPDHRPSALVSNCCGMHSRKK